MWQSTEKISGCFAKIKTNKRKQDVRLCLWACENSLFHSYGRTLFALIHVSHAHTETFAGRSLPNWWVERIKRVRLCEAATREHWKITSNRIERVKRQKSSSTHSTRQKRKSHRINSNTAAAGVYAIHTSTSSRFSQFDNFWCSDNTVFCLFLCTYSLTYRPVILYYINVCAYAFHPYFPGIKIYLVKFFFLVFCCVH